MTTTKTVWLSRIPQFRRRNYRIVGLLAQGKEPAEICGEFGINPKQVKNIVREMFNLMLVEAPKKAVAHPFRYNDYPHLYKLGYRSTPILTPNQIEIPDFQKEKEFVLRMLSHIENTFH
jgi:hypothetical protein